MTEAAPRVSSYYYPSQYFHLTGLLSFLLSLFCSGSWAPGDARKRHEAFKGVIEYMPARSHLHVRGSLKEQKASIIRCNMTDRLCEETLAATMKQFTLDHALSCAALQFTRSEFLTYILETKVPGLHFNVDDEEKFPKSTVSTHMMPAERPRIVDGAREAHMIAGHLQNEVERDSDNAAMKILEEQGSKGDPSPVSEEAQMFTGGEPGDVVSDGISHSQCLEFLSKQGPHFLIKNFQDKETICSVLLAMAEYVKVLPPGNEPLPWDVLNMTLWKASLSELMKEMKTVEEKCSSLNGTSGVYVLTTSPYSAFLRALAAEIADADVQIQLDN